ncbi:FAD:protein FMN transferase [Bacillus sp. 03113]|uniref:FAD:protein FMN transferase n=1 Tax=Bacillus sp. 03113 TaxID=2578211 RepID=UPI0015E8E116|nr:FAD:protein FMN transferase [Bacillus sp. 03113]
MKRFYSKAMNTDILTVGLSPVQAAEVFQWFELIEKQFSRFLPSSELSRVNGNAGKETLVSERFIQIFYQALLYYEQTEGIFTPFLGAHMNRLGYDKTFENIHDSIIQREHPKTFSHHDEKIFVNIKERMVKTNSKNLLDFGGIAKGWSVQQIALKMINKLPAGLIDAGGDIFAWNNEDTKKPWIIGIAHPYSDTQSIAKLTLKSQAGVATSTISKRYWKHQQMLFHHIIDPRTALPAQSDCIQATVIGNELLPAEVYAKCLLILGSQKGPAWLKNRQPDLAYILVDKKGRQIASSNLNRYCHEV